MDVQMPEMDGLEAARYIRDSKSTVLNHQIPIIAMTGNAMRGDREKCLRAGMNDYVPKPVNPQVLSEAIEKWLPPEKDDVPVKAPAMIEERLHASVVQEKAKAVPVFDKPGMMARLMDDEGLARKVLQAFMGEMPQQIRTLKECLDSGDNAKATRQAHSIKGAVRNVGGEAMGEVAFEMETAGKAGNREAVLGLMPQLERQFDRLKEAIQEYEYSPGK
jgi:HPt (histidine-containing phosphotransfer) domain-containing protein